MDTGKIILGTVLAGIAAGILLSPERGKNLRSKLYKGKSFNGRIEKELSKVDSAIRKQLKTARKEIADLIQEQFSEAGR